MHTKKFTHSYSCTYFLPLSTEHNIASCLHLVIHMYMGIFGSAYACTFYIYVHMQFFVMHFISQGWRKKRMQFKIMAVQRTSCFSQPPYTLKTGKENSSAKKILTELAPTTTHHDEKRGRSCFKGEMCIISRWVGLCAVRGHERHKTLTNIILLFFTNIVPYSVLYAVHFAQCC